MILATTPDALQTAVAGRPVVLVPTMGALHEGHLTLVDRARRHEGAVVLSIFVNPLQFGPGEDLDRYPRTLDHDCALAEDRGADVVFAPAAAVMYPEGNPTVTVDPGSLADRLCGASRPGHFRGVLTVVAKLFGLTRPRVAVFGRKDFQQTVLIRRMVQDLDMGVQLDLAPISREADGLARSSRNAYLTAEERAAALGLSRALHATTGRFAGGERDVDVLLETARRVLDDHPGLRVEYVEIVALSDLAAVREAGPGDVLALAAHSGSTRLIDNATLGEDPFP